MELKQLLQISILRIRGKQHVKFFDQRLELQSLERYMVPTEPLPRQHLVMKVPMLSLRFLLILTTTTSWSRHRSCLRWTHPRQKAVPCRLVNSHRHQNGALRKPPLKRCKQGLGFLFRWSRMINHQLGHIVRAKIRARKNRRDHVRDKHRLRAQVARRHHARLNPRGRS